MSTSIGSHVPILVISCDRYADLWPPFFALFWRRWPDCPFPVYLGSNRLTYSHPRVRPITVGADISWASSVSSMLDRLDAEHVIILLEDFFIQEVVRSDAVERLVRTACAAQVDCVRLSPLPPPSRLPVTPVPAHPEFGIVEPGTPYRVSAQPAVWRVQTLRRYLVPGFNAWEFEMFGTQLSESEPHIFWGPFAPTLVYDQAIEKGRWRPEGIAITREAGLNIDFNARVPFSDEEFKAFSASAEQAYRRYELKRFAMDAFRTGQRIAGLRDVLRALSAEPVSLHLWAILACGLAGPRAMAWLRRQHLRRRVGEARKRYDSARAQLREAEA